MRILNVVSARPNFIKVAPVHSALVQAGHDAVLIHTGQHYDANMSAIFFDDLGMPKPDRDLGIGSAPTNEAQTAAIESAVLPVVHEIAPDLVLVAGDVNGTLASARAAVTSGVPVVHLEAGLRSFDSTMPEEVNRVLTDGLSRILLTPSAEADDNLLNEGIPQAHIFRVGNSMIDSLNKHLERAKENFPPTTWNVDAGAYAVATIHREFNVDNAETFRRVMDVLDELATELPVLYPVHPRARRRMHEFDLRPVRTRLINPLGYLEFLSLQAHAALVLTDSGGVQEETTCLGVPCLTLRPNTERPVTVTQGTNLVVGSEPAVVLGEAHKILRGHGKKGRVPDLWDGQVSARIVDVLEQEVNKLGV